MKLKNIYLPLTGMLMLAMALIFTLGCEKKRSTKINGSAGFDSQARVSTSQDLELTPTSGTADYIGQKISFRINGGAKTTYAWVVDDSTVGKITPNENTDTAIYLVKIVAANTITITDSEGHSAQASIESGAGALSIIPSSPEVDPDGGGTISFSAINGVSPYTWSNTDSGLGSFAGNVYTYLAYGSGSVATGSVDTIVVKDSRGETTTTTVTRQ